MKKKQVVSRYNYKMALMKTSVFTYANSLSTPSHHPCHSLFFSRDHLRSLSGIISGPGSFAVQFGDHLRSGIIYGPGIICGPVQYSSINMYLMSCSLSCNLTRVWPLRSVLLLGPNRRSELRSE